MARKNRNARKRTPKLNIPKNHHFMYSTDEFGADASVVRYLGEQDGDQLLCFHPEGFELWIHVSHLSNVPKSQLQAA